MSFVYSYARFASCVLLCFMHAILLILIALPFSIGAGSVSGIVSLVFAGLAMLLTMIQFVILVISGGMEIFPCIAAGPPAWYSRSEPGNKRNIILTGIISFLTLLVSVVMTAYLSGSQLQKDYSGLGSSASAGSIVVPLAWCTTGVAIAALAVAYLDKLPDVPQVTSFGTHRVVWRTDNIPMSSRAARKPSSSSSSASYYQRDRKWPQAPAPARTHWTERRPQQIRTTYSEWPNHAEV